MSQAGFSALWVQMQVKIHVSLILAIVGAARQWTGHGPCLGRLQPPRPPSSQHRLQMPRYSSRVQKLCSGARSNVCCKEENKNLLLTSLSVGFASVLTCFFYSAYVFFSLFWIPFPPLCLSLVLFRTGSHLPSSALRRISHRAQIDLEDKVLLCDLLVATSLHNLFWLFLYFFIGICV